MKIKTVILSIIVSLSILSFQSCGCAKSCGHADKPVVIFDTDLGNDVDDVLALQMLLNYAKEGTIDFRGIILSKCNPHSVEFVDAFCRHNGFDDMPIGYAYNGVTPDDYKYLLATLNATYQGKPIMEPNRTLDASIPEGYVELRRLLSEAKNGSVTLIAVGPLTNIGRLLSSGPDDLSSLSGKELMKKKVKSLNIMGGEYLGGKPFAEYNIKCDLKEATVVFAQCPVPIVASGFEIGKKILYPHESILNDFGVPEASPLCVAYMSYEPMPYDRPSWDLTSVFDAIDKDRSLFRHSAKGTISVDGKGVTTFNEDPKGKDEYLIVNPSDVEKAKMALVNRVRGK
ncbi:MAG: nucleoside hydrolase [Bacteroidales bacterium]